MGSSQDYEKLKIQRKINQIKLENANKILEESQLEKIDNRHKVWTSWYSMKVEQYKLMEKKEKNLAKIYDKSVEDYKNDRLKNMQIRQLDLISWTRNKLQQIRNEQNKIKLEVQERQALEPTPEERRENNNIAFDLWVNMVYEKEINFEINK